MNFSQLIKDAALEQNANYYRTKWCDNLAHAVLLERLEKAHTHMALHETVYNWVKGGYAEQYGIPKKAYEFMI